MLKRIVGGILRSRAPYIFWALRLSRMRRYFGEEELHVAPLLCDKQKPSVDIGAERGVYTAHILDKSHDCLAFEPRPTEAAELKEMFGRLSLPVRVEAVALSDTRGEARLRILEQDGGRSTIESDNTLEDPDGSGWFEITVPMRRLDDYALEAVGFIKIDVEGYEHYAFKGAENLLRKDDAPGILFEFADWAENLASGLKAGDAQRILKDFGYDLFIFNVDQSITPINDILTEGNFMLFAKKGHVQNG